MSTNPKPAYRRVLLKLSGEALQGSEVSALIRRCWNGWPKRSKSWLSWVFRSVWSSVAATCSVVPACQGRHESRGG